MLALLLVAGLVQACSDNKGPSGPTFGAGQTGHADTAGDILVQVAINPNTIQVGQRAGITVLVTNANGRPLENRQVQVSTTAGRLDRVDGATDAQGKFVTFLFVDPGTAATSATISAFVEGAIGTGVVTFFTPGQANLVIVPANATRTFGAAGVAPGTCAQVGQFTVQFAVAGGVPPYRFVTSGQIGGVVSGGGLYTAPSIGPVTGGFNVTETVTVLDSVGNIATATVTVSCTAVPPPTTP